MCVLIYRWRLRPGHEADFAEHWASMTVSIREQCGSLGSRLHRCEDGTWAAYAAWPDRKTQRACQPTNPHAMAGMQEAIEELLEPLRLDVVTDLLIDRPPHHEV